MSAQNQPEQSFPEPTSAMGTAVKNMSRGRETFASNLAKLLEKASPNLPQLPKRNNQPVQRL